LILIQGRGAAWDFRFWILDFGFWVLDFEFWRSASALAETDFGEPQTAARRRRHGSDQRGNHARFFHLGGGNLQIVEEGRSDDRKLFARQVDDVPLAGNREPFYIKGH
jgi:hypothetical protein